MRCCSCHHWSLRVPLVVGITLTLVWCTDSKKASYSSPPGKTVSSWDRERWRVGGGGGGWSAWSAWSQCSRTCGGGVSTQTRRCLLAGTSWSATGKHLRRRHSAKANKTRCVGVYSRSQLCNSKPCPGKHSEDFRREQCSAYNNRTFSGQLYQWEPFIDASKRCVLNCRPLGLRFYATLAPQVVDGTPCNDGLGRPTHSVCVAGHCKQIGCDGIIGSGKVFDSCGVCGGSNSSCKSITGLFMNPDLPDGYNHIASIPQGACNINITEMKQSKNYLALRQEGGDYIINGNWAINWPGDYPAAGTVFTYQRDDSNDRTSECIMAKGPTKDPLEIMMIYKQHNPGIRYEYALPITMGRTSSLAASASSSSAASSSRILPPAIDTNHFNGDGLIRPHPALMTPLSDTPTRVHVYNKTSHNRPLRKNDLGRIKSRSRHYAWQESGFSQCSKSCAEGTRQTLYVCVKISSGSVANDYNCEGLPKPPPRSEKCNTWPCPPQWIPADWSECSVTCGHGVQSREITCMQQIKQNLQVPVADGLCTVRPNEHRRKACYLRSCAFWRTGKWSQCSTACGKGIRTRQVYCASDESATLPEEHCEAGTRPVKEEICDMGSCAKTWFFTDWSNFECSHKCGVGIQTRKVFCPAMEDGACDVLQKPVETQACSGTSKCSAQWFRGSWSQCSASCGAGHQVRDVICVMPTRGQYRTVRDTNCIEADKPSTKQRCVLKPCGPEWYTSDWSQCSKTCDTGTQTREVKCLDEQQKVSLSCSPNLRPITRQACATQECFLQTSQSDSACTDKFKNCHLVAQSRLCSYPYYRDSCCQSCAKFNH